MNNANFGNDCRDNRNNTKFQPILDEIEEINIIIFLTIMSQNL